MKLRHIPVLLAACAVTSACSTVPEVRAWRPWIHVAQGPAPLPAGAKVTIEIEAGSSPLLGRDDLLREELKREIAQVLARRGFVPGDTGDYRLLFSYRTERREAMRFTNSSTSTAMSLSSNNSSAGARGNAALGVAIAQVVASTLAATTTTATQTASSTVSYLHSVSLTLLGGSGALLWKGDSTWDSPNLDQVEEYLPAVRLLVSHLPDSGRPVEVAALKRERAINFFILNCSAQWFTNPAVPYRIAFPALSTSTSQAKNASASSSYSFAPRLPDAVRSPEALAACVDLVNNAEYALPVGASDYSDPLHPSLWAELELGGRYLLGREKQPVNLLVRLAGTRTHYSVADCAAVSDPGFAAHTKRMGAWKAALADYYDVYR